MSQQAQVIAYAVFILILATFGTWITLRIRRGWVISFACAIAGSLILWAFGLFPGTTGWGS